MGVFLFPAGPTRHTACAMLDVPTTTGAAFLLGLLSAASLPLGTLTAAAWQPGERVLAGLMAFGGGALLAAITVELVAPRLAGGEGVAVTAGGLTGGLFFAGLNHLVNSRGGFLRKASTVIAHVRGRRNRRFRRLQDVLHTLPVFRDLAPAHREALAGEMTVYAAQPGEALFSPGDAPDRLFVVDEGAVTVRRPDTEAHTCTADAAMGVRAFLAGTPHAGSAVAETAAQLWVLPRGAFERLTAQTPALAEAVARDLQGDTMRRYLRDCHGLDDAAITTWQRRAADSVRAGDTVPQAVPLHQALEDFLEVADHVGRFPVFRDLPGHELEAVASRLTRRTFRRGETLFHQGRPADHLYIVDHGEVTLVDPTQDTGDEPPRTIRDREAFGGLSFLTGARHSVSAVATDTTTVWMLSRDAFDTLVARFPALDDRVKAFLQREQITDYLRTRNGFDANRASRWVGRAVRRLESGGAIPSVPEAGAALARPAGVPVAIWLGMTLDAVPESLVIGATLGGHGVGAALIGGLFLSNYPEALSSSAGMREQGMGLGRVLFLWTALMVLTGAGAATGHLFFADLGPTALAFVQGTAAGAILTMIAETMLPEAYFRGGQGIGLATLLGFLAAVLLKAGG